MFANRSIKQQHWNGCCAAETWLNWLWPRHSPFPYITAHRNLGNDNKLRFSMEQENLDAWIVLHGNKYILGYIWSLGFDLAHPRFHTLSSTESRQGGTLQRDWQSPCAPEAVLDVWPWMWRASCLPELTHRLRSTETQSIFTNGLIVPKCPPKLRGKCLWELVASEEESM